MNENERGIFALHGITGMLIATALLLTILAVFTVKGISIQQENADVFYDITDEKSIKMIDTTSRDTHLSIAK